MRLFFLSHDSTANPTMTTICRQGASACAVDAIFTVLPLQQTLLQILFPKHFYLRLQNRDKSDVSSCVFFQCASPKLEDRT